MTAARDNVEAPVKELTALLDEEIELLDLRCSQLSQLCSATLHRDEDVLEKLLGEIERTQQRQEVTDLRLQAMRASLAGCFGVEPREMRLARLIELLAGEQAAAVDCRRRQMILLIDKLRRKHMETALIISECARLNHMLLESLMPGAPAVTIYGARGESAWCSDIGLVDVES
ncbi:MAG: hypothetical protein J7M14_03640 [Planctomycetes bacterium]|nr:hypothetical protein [Planctomycetota bacterium]